MTTERHNSRPWPPKEYKEAIGQIAVNSAQLEASIKTIIWHVAGVGSITGRVFTGKVRISDLIEMLKALIEAHAPHLLQDANLICTQINDLFKRRAEYVHQVWVVGENQQPAIGKIFLERQERKEVIRNVTLDEMYDLAESFVKAEGELFMRILTPSMSSNEQLPA